MIELLLKQDPMPNKARSAHCCYELTVESMESKPDIYQWRQCPEIKQLQNV